MAKASQLALFGAFLTTTWPQPRADRQYGVNLAALPIVKLSPVVIAWLSPKTGTTVRPIGLVSACKMDTPRAAHRVGGARAWFSHRIIKDHPHCPDILSLRQNRRTLASVSGRWSLLDGMNAFAIAESGMGHPLSGTRETWMAPFDSDTLHASRSTPHASRSTTPVPAGSGPAQTLPRWLLPATDRRIGKDRTGPNLEEWPFYMQYVTESGDCCGKIDPFLPTRCPPTVDHSLAAGDAQRQWLQARLPDGHQPQCQSLPDFPEFAQAVRYGVPGTPQTCGL